MERSWLYGHNARGKVVCAALLVLVTGFEIFTAIRTPIKPFNEPLWFMRGSVAPSNVSDDTYRMWAVDMPALGRWFYWAALKATGQDRVPPGEEPVWDVRDGNLYFKGVPSFEKWGRIPPGQRMLAQTEQFRGRYAPRGGIMVERMVNVAAYAALLIFLWLAARLALGSDVLAAVAVLPLCMLKFWVRDLAFVSMQGDVFLMAGLALILYLWLRFHMAGQGASWKSVILVGIAAGLATSGKHPGILGLAAFCVYLLWEGRGWGRLIKPAATCAIALAVFSIVNPAVWTYPGVPPWGVLKLMISQREEVVAGDWAAFGRPTWQETAWESFYWLPCIPVAFVAFWALRRERWIGPMALWGLCIVGGTVAALAHIRDFEARYFAPLQMGLYFPLAVAVVALSMKALGKREAQHE